MKYLAIASLILLGACATRPSDGGIVAAQNATVQLCGYLPVARVVGDLFLTGNPLYSTSIGIASAICGAVTTRPLADGPRGRIIVSGVVIKGRFVR